MKAAYLAYDKNSLAALQVLSNYFEQIDFFIVDQSRPAQRVDFEDVSLMTDTLQIPANVKLHTATQQKVLKSIQKEFLFYKNQLSFEYKKNDTTYTEIQKMSHTEINAVSDIKDVVFNSKTNEIYVEKAKSGITSYQALFIEDHQIVSENFGSFGKNIFRTLPENSHVWLSIEFNYELKKPREKNLGLRQFILIKDRLNKSVLDNWYFLRTIENKITVQQWVPFNQVKNSDFQKFMIERVEKILREKLDLIQVTGFNQIYVDATPGYSSAVTALRNIKISTLMPSFNFWPLETVNRFLFAKLDTKMKDLNKLQMAQNLPRG